MTPRDRLIVALDVADAATARTMVDRLAGHVGMFKVGGQIFTAAGPDFVREVIARGEKIFLDLKFHDIPNTVAGAVSAAGQLGVSLVDVHALGGKEMLEAAVGALPAMGIRLLAITILTSHDEKTLGSIGVSGSVADSVRRLAVLAKGAGADGVVASPQEVALVREACGKDFLVVTRRRGGRGRGLHRGGASDPRGARSRGRRRRHRARAHRPLAPFPASRAAPRTWHHACWEGPEGGAPCDGVKAGEATTSSMRAVGEFRSSAAASAWPCWPSWCTSWAVIPA